MTVRRPIAIVPLAAFVALALVPGAAADRSTGPAPQQPTFRSGSSAVAVDVTVRDRRRRAVTGLTAQDFQVYDNGVLQQVDDVSFAALPIDVTVALDVSFSVTGALLERLRRGVVDLMEDLDDEDRLKLVLFSMRVNRTTDFTTDVDMVERAMRGATAGGGTALYDAIGVSLVSASVPDRRQLVVFFTDGSDSVSTTTPAMLTRVAERTRATLTFVMPELVSVRATPGAVGSGMMRSVTVRGAAAVSPLFRALATETGGSVLPVGVSTDLTATFRRILAEFRSTYVLYYNARGVDRAGYHTLEVTVSREDAVVQARRGYFGS